MPRGAQAKGWSCSKDKDLDADGECSAISTDRRSRCGRQFGQDEAMYMTAVYQPRFRNRIRTTADVLHVWGKRCPVSLFFMFAKMQHWVQLGH
jgi:hypothetical protein